MNTPNLKEMMPFKERKSTAASFQNCVVLPKIKAQNTKHKTFTIQLIPKILKKQFHQKRTLRVPLKHLRFVGQFLKT